MVVARRSNPSGRRTIIRNQNLSGARLASPISLKQSLLDKQKHSSKKRSISPVKVAGYSSAFILLTGIIAVGYQSPAEVSGQPGQAASISPLATVAADDNAKAPSVDEMVANTVAASITEQANLPIAPNLASRVVSLSVQNELAQTDDTVVAKPQIIKPSESNRSVTSYTVKTGDTVPSVAAKFSLSPSTIRWANNLESDALKVGSKLKILPVDGVLHTFEKGESVNGLASHYDTSAQRITLYNDLDLKGPQPGQQLIIPNGILPRTERPGYTVPTTNTTPTYNFSTYFGGGGGTGIHFLYWNTKPISAGGGYAWGNCTWYAYMRRAELGNPIGRMWGDASSWAWSAANNGYRVDNTPAAGAVIQNGGGAGHVGVVESVKPNGDVVITEMNYGGWFNGVSQRTISSGQAQLYTYIH